MITLPGIHTLGLPGLSLPPPASCDESSASTYALDDGPPDPELNPSPTSTCDGTDSSGSTPSSTALAPSTPPVAYRIRPPRSRYKALATALSPGRNSAQRPRKPGRHPNPDLRAHCNTQYTIEQQFFIIYHHDDLFMDWPAIKEKFNKQFPQGPPRAISGLQSILYRLNEVCPVITDNNLLKFGVDPWDSNKYNQYDNEVEPAYVRGRGKVSLIDRYAEQVSERNWSWIRPFDMERAKRLATKRRPYRVAWEPQKSRQGGRG